MIVAGKTTDTSLVALTGSRTGLWFRGGFTSHDVPVILVSDGTIAIDRTASSTLMKKDCDLSWTSIFAGGVLLRGPMKGSASRTMQLHHDSGRDAEILDPLYEENLLPNTLGGRNRSFLFVRGTWREVTESNPS